MKAVLLALSFLFSALAQNSTSGGCDFEEVLGADAFAKFKADIVAAPFVEDKMKVVEAFVNSNNTLGLVSDQLVSLLQVIPFMQNRVQLVELLNDLILTLSVDGVVSIIKPAGFEDERLKILALLVNLTSEADLKANSSRIVAVFNFASGREKAAKIIAASSPRSCLFGPADIPRFAFIVDVSGSMSTQFKDTDGTLYTRLQYVQKDLLHVINGTLRPSQEFNIIAFSDRAAAWQRGVVPVSYENILSASAWVKKLRPDGGTYVLNSLKLAFSDSKVLGVYLLSDGEPSDGRDAILSFVKTLNKPVNTIAFKAGVGASTFMEKVAQASKGGRFRAIA